MNKVQDYLLKALEELEKDKKNNLILTKERK